MMSMSRKIIRIALPKGKMYQADLQKELSIDGSNVLQEVLNHSSKYAWWKTLYDVAENHVQYLEDLNIGGERHERAVEHRDTLQSTLEAFNHRESTLKLLLRSDNKRKVLKSYNKNITHLMGVI
jgi:hypothetical protein